VNTRHVIQALHLAMKADVVASVITSIVTKTLDFPTTILACVNHIGQTALFVAK
jgi:hypothetical protein